MEQLFHRILRALENQEFIEVKDATTFGSKLPHQDVFVRDMVRVTEYPLFCRQPHLNEASQPLLPTQGKIA